MKDKQIDYDKLKNKYDKENKKRRKANMNICSLLDYNKDRD